MFNVYKIKKILKDYQDVLEEIIKDYKLETTTKEAVYFKNTYGSTLEIKLAEDSSSRKLIIREKKQTKTIITSINLSKKNTEVPIFTRQTIIEKRTKGTIVEVVDKVYGFVENYPSNKRYVKALLSNRYVLKNINDIIDFEDEELINHLAIYKSSFEAILFSYSVCESPQEINNIVKNKTHSLSNIYSSIKGPDQVEIAHSLYNGLINEKNKYELLKIKEGTSSTELFDYKTKIGITAEEDKRAGDKITDFEYEKNVRDFFDVHTFYTGIIDINSRESILKALKYKPAATEINKQFFERTIGISYEEYAELDFERQQELITAARAKNKLNSSSQKEKVKSIFRKND